jgi:hypothetical protein
VVSVSAFGIGTNTEKTENKRSEKRLQPAAVKCWFTAKGKASPLMLKIQEGDELLEIRPIQVLTVDREFYAGIPILRYCCQAPVGNRMVEFTLLFYPEDQTWKLEI